MSKLLREKMHAPTQRGPAVSDIEQAIKVCESEELREQLDDLPQRMSRVAS
mgnify:CR=1 FL=1